MVEVLKCLELSLTLSWFRRVCVLIQPLKRKDKQVALGLLRLTFKLNNVNVFYHQDANALRQSLKSSSTKRMLMTYQKTLQPRHLILIQPQSLKAHKTQKSTKNFSGKKRKKFDKKKVSYLRAYQPLRKTPKRYFNKSKQ